MIDAANARGMTMVFTGASALQTLEAIAHADPARWKWWSRTRLKPEAVKFAELRGVIRHTA